MATTAEFCTTYAARGLPGNRVRGWNAGLALRRYSGGVATPPRSRRLMHPPGRGSRGSDCEDSPAARRADHLLCSRSRLAAVVSGSRPSAWRAPPVDETIGDLAERELIVLRAPQLTFERIKLDSPLEITVAAAGSTGVVICALHLLCAFLWDPEGIGWLPRLVAGWNEAHRDAEMARQEHRAEVIRGQLTDLLIKQNMSRLMRLAETLSSMTCTQFR
jgi:hypothetical protein